jgi:hypothetical protein
MSGLGRSSGTELHDASDSDLELRDDALPEIDHLVDGICATRLIWIYHLADNAADGVCVVTRLIWIYNLADETADQIWIWTQGIQFDHLVDESSFSFV